ncbi:MAG: GDP-mannose 4,6-dehydratase [Candidatus Cloacimonetes bacterium]|nr:GDP-mannose 4,6-dehydratase [Candidatus Cloacimonadota bacterium]
MLVTGGSGFIGSHLCERLLAEGHNVTCIDNFDPFYSRDIKLENLAGIADSENFTLCEGDITDADFMDEKFAKTAPDVVFHLAAMAGVRASIEEPHRFTIVNLDGTMQVLENCRKHGCNKLVFASSSSVYGNNKKVPFAEIDPVDYPISPYAATKKAGELLCHTYHHLYGISVAALRFFTVYGPRQRPDLAIHKFARKILAGEPVPVYGDGSTRRDYTFITDILDGVTRAGHWVLEDCRFDIFNLGESQTITLERMITTIEASLGRKAIIKRLPMQPGDVKQTFADISKAKQVLGYNPQTAFDTGIGEFVNWLIKKQEE